MKYTLLIFALVCFHSLSHCQYSDLKEYGFKGNIKLIHHEVYVKWKLIDGKFEMDTTDNLLHSKTMHFTPSGQMDTIRIFNFEGQDTVNKSMNVYDTEKDKNFAGREYDSANQLVMHFETKWINDRTYKMIATDLKGEKQYEITSWLSIDFQDSVGYAIVYENGEVVDHEKYINRLDSSKRVIGFDYFDENNKPTKSQIVEYHEFDENGNWTLSILRDAVSGEFIKRSVRTIEYY